MLESLSEVYLVVGGEGSGWREKGFKRAAAVLRGLGTEISGVQQLRVRREKLYSSLPYDERLVL